MEKMYLLTRQKNKRFQMMALFIFSKYFLNCIFRAGIDQIKRHRKRSFKTKTC